MNLPLDEVVFGNCLDVLRTLPDESIDSVVTDPPYGLGSKDPEPFDIFMYVLGASLDTGGDFMGKDWEIPSVAVWREAFRVLKPGGYLVSFGGTRTFDLISIGIRMAGFECRDTIAREFPEVELPILQWIQAQGMPKSHAIGKAIDKKLGKEREVVGISVAPDGKPRKRGTSDVFAQDDWTKTSTSNRSYPSATAAASDEAKEWEGWGSALKPAWEPILLFRKPLKGTLASNVLEYGTGGINIDATRVRHASRADFEAHKAGVDAIKEKGGSREGSWKNSSDLSGANEVKEGGRWPANVLLGHSDRCRRIGTTKIKGNALMSGVGRGKGGYASGVYGSGWKGQPDGLQLGHVDGEGFEEIEAWECVDQVIQTTWATLPDGSVFCLEQASLGEWSNVLTQLQSHLGTRSEGIENTRASGPEHAPSYRESLGSPDDCPACVHSCDELLHLIEDAGQGGPQRLSGALEYVLALVRSRTYSLPCQYDDLPSSSDDSHVGDASPYTPSSSTSPSSGIETPSHRRRNSSSEQPPSALRDSNRLSSTDTASDDGLEKLSGSAHIDAQLRRVLVSSMNAVATYIPLSLRVVERKSICPVRALNKQSGDRPSTLTGRADPSASHEHPGTEMNPNSAFLGERTHLSRVYADAGGAARFFSQFDGTPFRYVAKANRKEAGAGEFEVQHVTVKPLSLMRWVVKLVTRKGGVVLDPYAGSGSTLHAAALEGMHFIGIERHQESHAEAQKRLEIVQRQEAEKQEAEDLHDFALGRGG